MNANTWDNRPIAAVRVEYGRRLGERPRRLQGSITHRPASFSILVQAICVFSCYLIVSFRVFRLCICSHPVGPLPFDSAVNSSLILLNVSGQQLIVAARSRDACFLVLEHLDWI
jgi:hypothetical protein